MIFDEVITATNLVEDDDSVNMTILEGIRRYFSAVRMAYFI
jgi:hypothetical protein